MMRMIVLLRVGNRFDFGGTYVLPANACVCGRVEGTE